MANTDSHDILSDHSTHRDHIGRILDPDTVAKPFPISSATSSRSGRNAAEDHSINRSEYDGEPYTDLDDIGDPNEPFSNDVSNHAPSCRSSPFSFLLYQLKRLMFFVYNQLRSLTKRWLIGVAILLVVNFIWAASSIAVQALFSGFDKPFFLTYFSTSLFTTFLAGFVFLKSWRDNDSISDEMRRNLALSSTETQPLMPNDTENYNDTMNSSDSNALNPTVDHKLPNDIQALSTAPIALHHSGTRLTRDSSSDSPDSLSDSGEGTVKLRNFAEESGLRHTGLPSRIHAQHSEANRHQIGDDSLSSPETLLLADENRDITSSDSRDLQSGLAGHHTEVNAEDVVVPIMKVKQVAILALQFLPIWFVANVTFNWSLRGTSVTSNSIISTTSSFWTLLFCHIFKVERFTILRVIALVVTIGGVSVVAFSDQKSGKDSLIGDSLAVISAVCYGLYASFLRIKIKDEKQVKMAMFFGFVGFFNLVLMWPAFFILHFTKLEVFELPSLRDTLILTINGFIGTVLSDLLWSLVIFLTSATVATVGLSLNVPFSLILDIFVKRRKFPPPYYIGAVIVLIGFLTANLSQDTAQEERKAQNEQAPDAAE